MYCVKCGYKTEDKIKFCPKCGGEVAEVIDDSKCAKCGKNLKGVDAKFCPFCGTKIHGIANNKPSIQSDVISAQRVTVKKKKKHIIICFAVLMSAIISVVFVALKIYMKLSTYYINDEGYVVFGHYEQDGDASNGTEPIEWMILYEDEEKLILISRYCIEALPYNEKYEYVSWEDCSLRAWLQSDFYINSFDFFERKNLIFQQNDIVSCLSYDECKSYFDINYFGERQQLYSRSMISSPTVYSNDKGLVSKYIGIVHYDYLVLNYGYEDLGVYGCKWWLKSDNDSNFAPLVYPEGLCSPNNTDNISKSYGVRPVIVVRKTSNIFDALKGII